MQTFLVILALCALALLSIRVGWFMGRNHTYNVVKVFLHELAGYVSKERCFCYQWMIKTENKQKCLACRAKEFVEQVMKGGVSEP